MKCSYSKNWGLAIGLWMAVRLGAQPAADAFGMDLDSLANAKVTTASKFAEKLSEAPGVISVVTRDEMRRFGGITLREVLERVPGLSGFRTGYNDRSIMAVRGAQMRVDGGHVLILVNGRPTREVVEGGVNEDLLESFPVNSLERIEVIRGPGSVLYGSDAFSGVINLITQKGGRGFHVSSGAGPGVSTNGAEVFWERGALQVMAAGQFRQRPPLAGNYRFLEIDPTRGRLGQITLSDFSLRDQGVGGYTGVNYKGLSFMTSYTQLQGPSFTSSTVGELRRKRGFADLGYAFRVTSRWEMSANLTYTRTYSEVAQDPWLESGGSEGLVEWGNLVTVSSRDKLTFGARYQRGEGWANFTGLGRPISVVKGRRSGTGFYAQHEHRLREDLKLVGGFQVNKIGNIQANFVPRGGVVWSPREHWTLKALYGEAFRAPSISETSVNLGTIQGNPRLGPETVGTFDASAGYQGARLEAVATYFRSRYRGLVLADASTFPLVYQNRGGARFEGVEFEGKYYFARNWLGLGSVMEQRNQSRTAGPFGMGPVTPVPGFLGKAGVSYLAENGWTTSLFYVYQPATSGYGASLNPRPRTQQLVNAHVRYDLSKRLLQRTDQGFALFVHGDNLANRPVWLPDWGYGIRDTIPARAGRSLYFGIEVWQKQ